MKYKDQSREICVQFKMIAFFIRVTRKIDEAILLFMIRKMQSLCATLFEKNSPAREFVPFSHCVKNAPLVQEGKNLWPPLHI